MVIVDSLNHRSYLLFDYLIPALHPYLIVHVQPRSHDSANCYTAKFIRENKSPEEKSMEILAFGVCIKIPLFLREEDDRQNYDRLVFRPSE